ncbi:T9SS type A sorting domain-containing protein [Pedobacter sp. AW31-3R]|uniref:T9SS type A sorting domain-containing protein n=1 Tax=Pedobacter sp. AW31-3R TaxID=3445781 RepID=UPI003FA06123
MNTKTKTISGLYLLCIICIGVFCSSTVFGQRSDSISTNSKYKRIAKTPQIKGDVPVYKPNYTPGSSFTPYSSLLSHNKNGKQEKVLSVLKVYPNPVDDQVNLVLRLEREANIAIKIMDLLGNEVVTLANERVSAGEQTKTYTIPNRLNSGIYFLRIVTGSETVVKRISVL